MKREANFTDNLTVRDISQPEELADVPTEGDCFESHVCDIVFTFHQSLQSLMYLLVT